MTPTQREDIERKYEAIYGSVERAVIRFIAETKGGDPRKIYMDLQPIVDGTWSMTVQGHLTPEQQQAYYQSFLNAPIEWTERGVRKTGTRQEFELSVGAMYAEIWRDHAPSGCDLVVELGCGWGHRFVDTYLSGLDTRYVGGDRSDHSRNIVRAVTGLFPDMKADWFRFDFLKPDFAALPEAKRVLFMTCHAIEQVTVLGRDVFDAMIKRFPGAEIVGVHIEPISFQINPKLDKERLNAEKRKYNTDLYSVVKSHPSLEVLSIDPVLMDSGDGNATALLIWKNKRP